MAPPVFAQSAEDRFNKPTELGIRFTPAMAEALAKGYIANVVVPRYELAQDKVDEATEAIARRLMVAAHSLDTPEQQANVERLFADTMNAVADSANQSRPGMPRGIGMAFGKGLKPLLPAVREVIRGAGEDLRPMLSLKQQLNLGKDLLTVGMSLDAFEKTLDRWEKGDVKPFEDPFKSPKSEIQKDEQGRSPALNQAMQFAQGIMDKPPWKTEWERYVEQAKEYYQFDESQATAADSQLREALQQAERISQNERWRQVMYRNRIWEQMAGRVLYFYGHHPMPHLIFRSYRAAVDPISRLGDALKMKIDRIATSTQRREAERRMTQLLKDKGFLPEDF